MNVLIKVDDYYISHIYKTEYTFNKIHFYPQIYVIYL